MVPQQLNTIRDASKLQTLKEGKMTQCYYNFNSGENFLPLF